MKTLVCSVSLLLVGVAPVAADNDAPKSLRMRDKKALGSQWTPMRWAKRVAQAQPAPDQPAPDPAATAAPAADAAQPAADPAAPAAEPAPATETPVAEQPAASATAQAAPVALTDEELAKLAEQEAKTEVITVTGSLIGRKEVDSPSPVSVVDRQKLDSAGITNVGDILQKIPAQGNAINAQNNNGGNGSVRISLRSLGASRTLVLMNGRRVVPSGNGANSSVDFGTIPLAMIERVEVLKDGASAIYGSDAIAGVVNVITRSNMSGTEANIYTSTSAQRDGTNYDLSFVTGHSSNRGNITFSGGYQQQKPVMAGDRNFSKLTYAYDFACTPENEAAGKCAKVTLSGSTSSPSGRIGTKSGTKTLAIPGCTPDPTFPYCTADGAGGFRNFMKASPTSFGDNYNFQPLNYLFTPSTRVNLFSNGHYDITKNTHVFFEGQFNLRKSEQQLAETPVQLGLFRTPISKDSIYNPFGLDVVDYNRRLTEFGPRIFTQEVNTNRMVFGLNGNLPEDAPLVKNWKWETSYNYGRTDATNQNTGNLIKSHMANAIGPSYIDPALGPQCGTPGNPIPGCVPLDMLHPGHMDQRAIAYMTFTGTQAGVNEQHTTLATASGKLFDLPNHGDVSLAVGGDYRFERGSSIPDPLTSTGDTTGNASQPTIGSYNTLEAFSELSIVPFSGGDALKWVEINAAGRAYRYNTFGSGATGKVSGLVRTLGGVALRGTYGTAFRAPNVAELFAGQGDGFPSVEDPCDTRPPSKSATGKVLDPMTQAQCTAQGVPMGSVFGTSQQRALGGGNPNLKAEHGNVTTAGMVYEPLRGLDFTVDYWRINIDEAITTLQPATILAQCYQGGVKSFCDQIQRDPETHVISHLVNIVQNVGGLSTSGLDFSAAYQYKNAAGTFRHAIEGTYLFKYNVDTGTLKNPQDPSLGNQIVHGRGYYDLGVNPDLKFNIFTLWNHPSGLGGGFNIRFIDSFQECGANNCNLATNGRRDVPKYTTGDVYLAYSLKTSQGTTGITAGMNNIANASPATIYNGGGLNSDEGAYDFMGRQFYLRLSQLF